MGFTGGSVVKNLPASAGEMGSIPGLGRSPGEWNGTSFQYSCLEKSHGQSSLVGYSTCGGKELDTTELLNNDRKMTDLGLNSDLKTSSSEYLGKLT